MLRIRDPQGHKIEVTQEQFDGQEPVTCHRCGWTRPTQPRSATKSKSETAPAQQAAAPATLDDEPEPVE